MEAAVVAPPAGAPKGPGLMEAILNAELVLPKGEGAVPFVALDVDAKSPLAGFSAGSFTAGVDTLPKVPFEAAGANEYEGLGVCGVLGKGKGRPPLPCFPASAVSFEGVGSLVLGLPKVKPLFAVGGKGGGG